VAEPSRVLVELGLHNATLDTAEVSRLLQEEVAQASEVLTYPTVQAGLLTIQTEARVMRGSLDCLGEERDKLRQDLVDANQRSELLAQEIDEQHARQEKEGLEQVQALETRWAEQVREVTRQAEEEQEATHDKVFELQRLLSQNSSNFKSIESHLKKDIENLLKENDRLEVENKTLQQQSREAEELLRNMKREEENIGLLRKHLMVVENGARTGQNGRIPDLAKQVEELAAMNKDLKDKNDELILHLKPTSTSDGCRTTICMERQIGKAPLIPGSTLYSEDFLSYDDKENTPKPDDNIQRISIKDVNEQDSGGQGPGRLVSKIPISGETQDCERSMKKNHQIVSNIFNPFMNTFNGSMLPIDDLDQVKYKIVEILSQKDNYSRENQSLKSHQTAYSELLRQNEELRQKVKQLECETVGEVPDLICESKSPRVEVPGVDRSSPDGQEGGAEEPSAGQSPSCQDEKKATGGIEAQSEVKELQLLRQKMLELEQERRRLLEKNKQLEESLELMSNEFESMEDYWQQKLDSERAFGEEQLKSSEAQFRDLELRLREYEDLLVAADGNDSDHKGGMLATIDEDRDMEEKVLGWEEEIACLHATLEEMEERHKKELEEVKVAMASRHKAEEATVKAEVRRLQELRRYIQQECDQLMLRKEQLKQDITQLEQKPQQTASSSTTPSSGPPSLDNPYASVTSAYRVILEDISREKTEIEGEAVSFPVEQVQQRLGQQVNRCKQLQSALALQKAQAARSMEVKREQHLEEMAQLEALVNSSQALVTRQNRRFMEQMDKMVTADSVIEKLLVDNNHLTSELKKMKNKFKVSK